MNWEGLSIDMLCPLKATGITHGFMLFRIWLLVLLCILIFHIHVTSPKISLLTQFWYIWHLIISHTMVSQTSPSMDLLPDTWNCGLRMRRECRKRFPRHQLQRKLPVSNPDMHHGTCVTHVPWCMSGSLTCGGRGKRSRHSRRMRNPQFYISGKRPITPITLVYADKELVLKWQNNYLVYIMSMWCE